MQPDSMTLLISIFYGRHLYSAFSSHLDHSKCSGTLRHVDCRVRGSNHRPLDKRCITWAAAERSTWPKRLVRIIVSCNGGCVSPRRFRYSGDEDHPERSCAQGIPHLQNVCGQSHRPHLRSGQRHASGQGGNTLSHAFMYRMHPCVHAALNGAYPTGWEGALGRDTVSRIHTHTQHEFTVSVSETINTDSSERWNAARTCVEAKLVLFCFVCECR